MTKLIKETLSDTYDIRITFANTGAEHETTLRFIDNCDKHFGWGVVWLEGVFTKVRGIGPRHKIVSFETAARNSEPFESYIEVYGMPDRNHPHCTARLKEDVMNSYLRREVGWRKRTYWSAVGIRADEMDRVSRTRLERRLVYPLVDAGWRREDVLAECARWPFDLELPGDHYGNCVFCWKKSLRKLMTLAKESPAVFDFPKRMEDIHAWTKNTEDTVQDELT